MLFKQDSLDFKAALVLWELQVNKDKQDLADNQAGQDFQVWPVLQAQEDLQDFLVVQVLSDLLDFLVLQVLWVRRDSQVGLVTAIHLHLIVDVYR